MNRARPIAVLAALATLTALAVAVPSQAGAVVDTTAPTITSMSAVETTVSAGDPILLRYTAVDDLSGVWDVTAQFQGPGGTTIGLIGVGGGWSSMTAAGGPVAGVVPVGAPGGTYTLMSLVVADNAGNSTVYHQGEAVSTPAGAPALLDLSAVTVTVVQPGAVDLAGPRLTSFRMLTTTARHPGEFVTFAFTATDASPITDVFVQMIDSAGVAATGRRGGGILTSGRLSVWIPQDKVVGRTWHVDFVRLTDSAGNLRLYGPYNAMALPLVAGATRFDPLVMQDERPEPLVRTTVSRSLVATGAAVTIGGTVSYVGKPVPFPTVAIYGEAGGVRTFLGLAHGTASGAFAKRVVPSRTTVYRVRFLGGGRVYSTEQTVGSGARVWTGTPQALAVAATSVRVPSGRTGVLAVTLLPRRSALVTLQRWTGRAWVKVVTVRTRSTGASAVRVPRPTSVAAYRWTTVYDGVGLPAVSRTVTVRAA